MKIISGGQTGADRAALDVAIQLGFEHGGWLPKGRKTENGALPARYHLRELDSTQYRQRTEKNVLEGDATLILSHGPLSGGSALTQSLAVRHDRPVLHLDLEQLERQEAKMILEQWLARHQVSTLNVAGPRASGDPQIYEAVFQLLCIVNWPAAGD